MIGSVETLRLLSATFRQPYYCVRNYAIGFSIIGKYLTKKFLKGSSLPKKMLEEKSYLIF